MKPVLQTILDDGIGNCMAACIASLLELQIEDVPNFVAEEKPGDCWLAICNRWLAQRGLCLAMVGGDGLKWLPDGVPYIVSCESPRSTPSKPKRHAVIMANRGWATDILHDPYPNDTGRVTGGEYRHFVYLLVPINPAKLTGQAPDTPSPGAGGAR